MSRLYFSEICKIELKSLLNNDNYWKCSVSFDLENDTGPLHIEYDPKTKLIKIFILNPMFLSHFLSIFIFFEHNNQTLGIKKIYYKETKNLMFDYKTFFLYNNDDYIKHKQNFIKIIKEIKKDLKNFNTNKDIITKNQFALVLELDKETWSNYGEEYFTDISIYFEQS